MKNLYLIRGLPGSGKTTLAESLVKRSRMIAADDFFTAKDGTYHFDRARIGKAHEWCQEVVRQWMLLHVVPIAVHNTFSQRWEALPYFQMAKENGYSVVVIECQNNFGSVHGVPQDAIDRMRDRWESYAELTP